MIQDTTSRLTFALAEFGYASAVFAGRQAVNIFVRGDLAGPMRQAALLLTAAADILAGGDCSCGERAGMTSAEVPAGSGWGPGPGGD